MTPHAKFHVNLHKGEAFRQIGEIYAKIAVHIGPIFLKTYPHTADFCVRWLKQRGLAQECAYWKIKKMKLIFNVFIQKIPKKYNGAYWKN